MMELEPYTGTWSDDDPDANFKAAVAEYSRLDPLPTFEQLSRNTGIPVGSLIRYALVRWTAEGSEAVLALGPRTVDRMWEIVTAAEAQGTVAARAEAFDSLRSIISWLRVPLDASGD